MTYDYNNIFAKILRQEINCKIVYENACCIAFNDIHPVAPIHILVIPKKAYITFDDFCSNATTEEISIFFKSINEILYLHNLIEKGYRLISNAGMHGCQTVFHFHMHILSGKSLGELLP